ncbi:hypothetical protein SASPL_131300 [Salvia splendens]|uniref:Retrovirus-related Pol polyprotein from transposon TNT 1-94-like beta-barrel domain-containing protein n=1 Tax=Salvia splendens TaxID=180675 RepID=A0A8X8X7I6_SALSN|nr:hypothetical protein SASPL_131300 [Salvia splendens]
MPATVICYCCCSILCYLLLLLNLAPALLAQFCSGSTVCDCYLSAIVICLLLYYYNYYSIPPTAVVLLLQSFFIMSNFRPPIETTIKASSSSSTTDATSVAAFAVSLGKSCTLDSGASTHITGTKSIFSSFSPSSLPSVRLADGNYSPVTGTGVVKPTAHITLDNVLFAPNFPDLQTKRMIGRGHERGGLYYLDPISPVSRSALSAAVSPSIHDVIDLQQPLKPLKQNQIQAHVHCHNHLRLQLLKMQFLLMSYP